MWKQIGQAISQKIGREFAVVDTRSVSGGCINQGYRLSGNDGEYFVKLNRADRVEMFTAEALGLKAMHGTQTISIPKPICWGTVDSSSYIVLEWLDLARGGDESWMEMGRQLATMHRKGINSKFGFEVNNTIGSTPQINAWIDDWGDFFAEQRIGYQLKLAQRNGGNFPDTNIVIDAVRGILADRKPEASIVHGDLWSGNAAIAANGKPIIFDPATYYGDRETDIAMTELFGGFPSAFYRGYNEEWQLDSGYQKRKSIYNLYHVLNHFNLFGGGYGNQAKAIIKQVI